MEGCCKSLSSKFLLFIFIFYFIGGGAFHLAIYYAVHSKWWCIKHNATLRRNENNELCSLLNVALKKFKQNCYWGWCIEFMVSIKEHLMSQWIMNWVCRYIQLSSTRISPVKIHFFLLLLFFVHTIMIDRWRSTRPTSSSSNIPSDSCSSLYSLYIHVSKWLHQATSKQ